MNHPFISLSEDEVVALVKEGYLTIPIFGELLGDLDSPVSVFYKLGCHTAAHSFLLESVVGREKIGRYSFLGKSYYKLLKAKANTVQTGTPNGNGIDWQESEANPLAYFTGELDFGSVYTDKRLPNFYGGAVGYISYDSIRYTEEIPTTATDDLNLPDLYFLFCDEVVLFDHVDRVIRPVLTLRFEDGASDADIRAGYQKAVTKLGGLSDEIRHNPVGETDFADNDKPLEISQNMKDADYEKIVADSIEYIKAGDIFQIVPSMRFDFELGVPPFQVYRALRIVNPSPYMYYLNLGKDIQIIGSSPEILLKGHGDTIEVRPIAGTRHRGETPAEDLALEKDLLDDPKEIAEHLMLIDLGRNDIGRVAAFDTVATDDLFAIERYSHVMHIASSVKGTLADDKTMVDALRSCLPAGTLSGAPKIRAMEIIDEFEPTMRGPYGGALGYFAFNGDTDTAIVIRTLVVKDGRAYLQAGAGIVYDSVPAKEREEVHNKMLGVLRAVELARSGKF